MFSKILVCKRILLKKFKRVHVFFLGLCTKHYVIIFFLLIELFDFFQPHLVTLRAPVSESLSRLHRDQLQKFAQYLISELPQQILPTAQRLLDELLSSQPSQINSVCGAPDPTAGASANDQTSWYLDVKALHGNIKKILIKFCVPAPMVIRSVFFILKNIVN